MAPKITATAKVGTLANDIDFPKGPQDTVSALRWSPKADHLAAASWDGKVYIYDTTNVATGASIRGAAALDGGQAPFLDCDFNQVSFDEFRAHMDVMVYAMDEGNMIAAASADQRIHIMDLNSPGQIMTLSGHTAPVRSIRWVDIPCVPNPTGLLVSGSWDKTLLVWDPRRQPNPVAKVTLSERVWAMDGSGPTLIAGTANNKLQVFNLGKMTQGNAITPDHIIDKPVGDFPIKSLAVHSGGSFWAAGSVGGRAAFGYADPQKTDKTFTFRCHRVESQTKDKLTEVYSVNSVAFARPPDGGRSGEKIVLATAGQDGTTNFWNIADRQRLQAYPSVGGSITACGFNWDATLFAYAVGYDWGKGYAGNSADHPLGLKLRKVERSLLR
ncbi:WD40-repeat-containing domain protein [Triangularia verruculosa]|uniref:WD40-repeat-containing domain protein n=1 Tax=Triangularia verruculosa TaxID=2587418 RepID=A0AAN6XC79_9PEZI|nr:WD40-repeat-containing domain protein [Triangularia verruculosa]